MSFACRFTQGMGTRSPQWRIAWDTLEPEFAAALERQSFADPVVWGGISSTSDRSELRDVLSNLGLFDDLPPDVISACLDGAVRLSETARGVTITALREHFIMPPEYFHMGRAEAAKRAGLKELDASRLRLRTTTLRALPSQWKG